MLKGCYEKLNIFKIKTVLTINFLQLYTGRRFNDDIYLI